MSTLRNFRIHMGWILTAGATLSIGFLSFAGMFLIAPSLVWCGLAFTLAVAYEGQINKNNIARALRRMFNPNYMKRGVIAEFLKAQVRAHPDTDNLFLTQYREWKAYFKKLKALDHPTAEQKVEKAKAKARLEKMEMFILKQLDEPETHTELERATAALLEPERANLQKILQRKKTLIRLSWLFAIGGGASSGLATLSAIHAGIALLPILSVIPGGILIALSACAAIGYTLLLYNNVASMIQEYDGKWKRYFKRRLDSEGQPLESKSRHVARVVGIVLAVSLAAFATIATAGTWWYAAQNGAALLHLGNTAASVIRSITVSLMALPTLIYNAKNSINSVLDMCKANLVRSTRLLIAQAKAAFNAEHQNFLRFLNPFRILAKAIDSATETVFFLGHIISMGIISDHLDGVNPIASGGATAGCELFTDYRQVMPKIAKTAEEQEPAHDEHESHDHDHNSMQIPKTAEKQGHAHDEHEGHDHDHNSTLLKILFLPVKIATTFLRGLAVVWDLPFSGSFKASWQKMFPPHDHNHDKAIVKPTLAPDWDKQDVIEACNAIKQGPKVELAQAIKTVVLKLDREELKNERRMFKNPLAQNSAHFWQQDRAAKQESLNAALDTYLAPRLAGG